MNVKQELEELKEMLQTEEDFGGIGQKFFNMTEQTKFLEMGKPRKNKLIELAVNKALSDLGMDEFLGIRITYLRKFKFYHGSFLTKKIPGVIFYYEDIQMGFVIVPRDFEGNIDYFRITSAIVMPGTFTSMKKSEETH